MTVHTASLSEGDFLPRRNGAHNLAVAPLGVLNGEQVSILIMPSTDHQFTYLCRAMGRPELAEDARSRSNTERMVRVEELASYPGVVRLDAER